MLVLAEWQVARDEKLSFTLCKRHVALKNIDTADTIGQWLFTSHDALLRYPATSKARAGFTQCGWSILALARPNRKAVHSLLIT